MAVDPVPGFGDINQGNAKEIYTAYRRGDVELNAAQKKYTEKFLTKEDFDEIDYQVAGNDGYNQIKDAKNADEHGGQGGNAVGVTGGNMASVVATTALANVASISDGFTAVILSIAAAACAGASIIFSKMFDNGYDDRTQANNNAGTTNETIDNNTGVLEESMDAMNEDADLYKEQNEAYTNNVITQTVKLADLKAQLADAQAAGDTEGAKRLQQQIQRLQKQDFSSDLEALEGTRAQLDEYSYANEMAVGVSEAGQSVSDFLKEGTALGVGAAINTAILLLGCVAMYMCSTSHCPKIWALGIPIDGAASLFAKITYAVCGALFATSASIMGTKTKNEFECGSSGRDMQGHVDTLNDMIGQQEGYIETTTGEFDESDEKSGENQDKARDATSKALSGRTAGSGAVKDDKPDKQNDQPNGNQPANA